MKHITFDFSNTLEQNIGKEHGITHHELSGLEDKLTEIKEKLQAKKGSDKITYINLPFFDANLKNVEKFGDEIRSTYDALVVVGIGGSALGPLAIFKALKHPYHNDLPTEKRDAPAFYVLDNVDPEQVEQLFDVINPAKTAFIVITKSGGTAETIANFMAVVGYAESRGVDIRDQLYFVTDPSKGKLRQLSKDWKVPVLDIPEGVGGRFSVLTPVGLLPSAALGVNVQEMILGAKEFSAFSFSQPVLESPAFLFAAVHYLGMKRGKPIHVMFPYANSLYPIADWFRQLWAESLGKKVDNQGNIVHIGPTPVKALGTTDQHSQVQLYVEGPNDKIYTFLKVGNFRKEGSITGKLPYSDFSYLEGASLQTLINAEELATEITLTENNRPNLTVEFDQINAYNIGAYFYMLELATEIMGELFNINAFDQPGVEHGKIATYALMGREGFEKQKSDIEKKNAAKISKKVMF